MTPYSSSDLQRHALDYWQVARNRLGLIFATFLVVFVAATLLTYIMPRKFRGRVEMVLERNDEDVRVEGHQAEAAPALALSDSFFKTQFETITKKKTLDRVVDKLDLQTRWGLPTRQITLGKLLANLNPESSIKSDFISIEYYDEDSQLAADVANAVAESYRSTRLEVDRSRSVNAVSQLDSEISAKDAATNSALQKMIEIKKRLGIVEMPVLNPQRIAGQDDVMTVDSSTLVDSERDVYKLKKDIRDMSAQIAQLRTLEGDDLIRQASDLRVENDTIRKLGPTYQDLLLKKQNLSSQGLGTNHPMMKGILAELAQTRTLLLDAAADYRKNLDTKIEIERKQLVEAESLNAEQRGKSINDQASNQEYLKAKKEWEILEMELSKLKDTRMQKEIDQQMSKTPITIHQTAEAEISPYKPKVALNLGLGAVVGLFLGFGLAFFLEYLDTSVKSLDDVEHYLGAPVLAVIPKNVPLLPQAPGENVDAEAYRILRTNLEFNRKDPTANCFNVVSGTAGEGKSTTTANLAFVCAQAGYNTLIIDGDMRRPRMHTIFGVDNSRGLSSYLTSSMSLEQCGFRTRVPNLYLMPSGSCPADSAGLLNGPRFKELIADMKSRFNVVLIDSPPILGISEASVLATIADASIVVLQHHKLPSQILQRIKQTLEQVGAKIIGVALNQVNVHSDAAFGYHTGYYGYQDARTSPADKPGVKHETPASGEPSFAV